jgi:hypothetical protein
MTRSVALLVALLVVSMAGPGNCAAMSGQEAASHPCCPKHPAPKAPDCAQPGCTCIYSAPTANPLPAPVEAGLLEAVPVTAQADTPAATIPEFLPDAGPPPLLACDRIVSHRQLLI